MTTGSIKTGTFPVAGTRKYHHAKAWNGADGRYVGNPALKVQAWNTYLMGDGTFRSTNPNQIGIVDNTTLVYSLRTNHSWALHGGSDPEALGYSPFGDGSFPTTFPTSQFNLIWTANEELALLAKLAAKVRGHQYDIGVALAEVDKLAGTVLGTLRNLVNGVSDIRKGDLASFARRFGAAPPKKGKVRKPLNTKDVSGRFLEMTYAWTPAISDAYEAAKAFEQLSSGPRRHKFRVSKTVTRKPKYATNYGIMSQSVDVKRSLYFEMIEEMDFRASIGLTHPGSILWERLPWSFVIDWFIPVGTFLSNFGVIPKMKGRWGAVNSMRWTSSGSPETDPSKPYSITSPRPDANWERYQLQRSGLSSVPPIIPTPKFRFIGAVHGKRILNAIALAHQKFF